MFRFTGEQRDSESGLYYLRARYYDPQTGRFLGRDPLGGWLLNAQSQNRYTYVNNNPVLLIDPTGFCGILDPADCVDDVVECVGNSFDCLKDPLADFSTWVYDHTIDPVVDAVEYCLSGGNQFFECLDRAHLALEGTSVILMGAIIVGAGCGLAPALLSPTGPGGWTLAGVVCLEASVGGAAGFFAGGLMIRSAVSDWEKDTPAIDGKE
jgi:RHS repeat-associated protein